MGSIGDDVNAPFPIVDFTPWFHPVNVGDKERVAKKLIDSCRSAGSIYITGHGISPESIQDTFATSSRLFALSEEDKAHTSTTPTDEIPLPRGWTRLQAAQADDSAAPGGKECYDIGSVEEETLANIWPPEKLVPGFQNTINEFHLGASKILQAVLAAMGLGLELDDPDQLLKLNPRSGDHLRIMHSPSVDTCRLQETEGSRMALHRDYSTMALIFQDDCGGLQMANPHVSDTEFFNVTPIPDTCVLTIGHPIEIWTNGMQCLVPILMWGAIAILTWIFAGILKAQPHRVGRPLSKQEAREGVAKERFSLPYFANPSLDTIIAPIPSLVDDEHPARYPAVKTLDLFSKGYDLMMTGQNTAGF